MLSINELRLGNWFTDPTGRPIQVEGIIESVQGTFINPQAYTNTDSIVGLEPDDCKPVLLTPAILERSGFLWNGAYWGMGRIAIKSVVNSNRFYYGTSLRVQHLHQLQNLCFALSGRESSITFEHSIDDVVRVSGESLFPTDPVAEVHPCEDSCVRAALRQALRREPKARDVRNCQRHVWEDVSNKWIIVYKGVPLGSIRTCAEGDTVTYLFTPGDCGRL